MATAISVPLLTYDDLDFIPKEREGDRQELFDGVLVVTPSPAPPHQRASGRLYRWLSDSAETDDLGEVFSAPIDVVFAPKIVAVPDIVFVRRANLGIIGPQSIEGAPDLIVEILSPSTRRRDLRAKKALYERFGVPEYWMVDLKQRGVKACVLRAERYECRVQTDGILGSVLVPKLEVDLAALFAGL